MAVIYACCRVNSTLNKPQVHKFDGVDLSSDVQHVRTEIAKTLNMPPTDLELIFCGKCLKVEDTLQACGVSSGMTIHVFRKQHQAPPAKPPEKPDTAKIRQLVFALKTAMLNPSFRTVMQRLSNPETLENCIVATPGLAEDPVAQAILQDPDMLMMLTDPTHIHRVVELHPCLAEAALNLAAELHEVALSQQNSQGSSAQAPPVVSYSLDALSDDEDMESDQNQDLAAMAAMAGIPLNTGSYQQGSSPRPITSAQLASALAAVASSSSSSSGNSSVSHTQLPPSPQLTAPPSTPRGVITPEMFTQAMQQALGVVQPTALQAQLQQLRDMGITDDMVSLRALEATGGDVHAALELIFGDMRDDTSSSS